jgi:hypothetical protein
LRSTTPSSVARTVGKSAGGGSAAFLKGRMVTDRYAHHPGDTGAPVSLG